MNKHFEAAAKAVKSIERKTGSLWENLVHFAVSCDPADPIKDHFKTQEREATVYMKVEMGKNSTYRVQKTLIVNAIAKGVPIVDSDGQPRGKTAVEWDLAALKVKKGAAYRFKIAMSTANNAADELTDGECIAAAALANDLLNKVSARIRVAA